MLGREPVGGRWWRPVARREGESVGIGDRLEAESLIGRRWNPHLCELGADLAGNPKNRKSEPLGGRAVCEDLKSSARGVWSICL